MNQLLRVSAFAVLLFIFRFSAFAQQTLHDATLNYRIYTMVAGNGKSPLDTNIHLKQYVVYLKGAQSRFDILSDLGNSTSVFDTKTSKGFSLRDFNGQKLMITLSDNQREGEDAFYYNMDFSVYENLTPIGEYLCKKAVSVRPQGKMFTYTVYFDPRIHLPNKGYGFSFKNLDGLPVRMEINYQNTTYYFELTNLARDPVPFSVFEAPKKGYKVISYEEMKELIDKE